MKKIFGYLIISFCLVAIGGLARAETFAGETAGDRFSDLREEFREKREDLRDKKQELREEFQEKKQEIRERFSSKSAAQKEKVIENIKRRFGNVVGHFNKAIERLDKIADKIQRRIDKLDEKGVDTSRAALALENCAGEKADAVSAVSEASEKIAAIDGASSTVRDAVGKAETAAKEAKEAIRGYHKCLVDVIKMLRAAVPKEGTASAK